MDSMMKFIMVGDLNSLQPHIATIRANNPNKVFLLYHGCIIQLSEEYAKANYKTKEFKTNVIKFIKKEGIKRCKNNSLSKEELKMIQNSNLTKIVIIK